jgi:hypothetical protein
MLTLYSMYIGTEQGKHGALRPADSAKALEVVRRRIAEQFGGYSEHPMLGAWIDSDKRLIQERSIRFDIVSDLGSEVVENVARYAGAQLDQSSVLVTSQALLTSEFCEVN